MFEARHRSRRKIESGHEVPAAVEVLDPMTWAAAAFEEEPPGAQLVEHERAERVVFAESFVVGGVRLGGLPSVVPELGRAARADLGLEHLQHGALLVFPVRGGARAQSLPKSFASAEGWTAATMGGVGQCQSAGTVQRGRS